ILRRYFANAGLSLKDPVQVDAIPPIRPGAPTTLAFRIQGKELVTLDGTIGEAELRQVLGPIEPIIQKVQRDAAYVEMGAALLDEVEDLESSVSGLAKEVKESPEDFALNQIFQVRGRVFQAKEALDTWQCSTGPTPAALTNLARRFAAV